MALAQRMHSERRIREHDATTLGVSRATLYRVLADQDG